MWTNFAKHLSPSTVGEPFPVYSSDSPKGMVLQTPSDSIENGYRASLCEVWDEIQDPSHGAVAFV